MGSNYFLLEEKIQNGIRDVLKWNSLTSIQEEAIPYILDGNNCVLLARTAGGKTEAAFIPILNTIFKESLKPISVIYISPVKALLNNQELRLKKLGKIAGVDAFKWHGEVNYSNKRKFAIEPKHIIATTPESLEVMLMSDSYDKELLFSNIRFVVIDEIHYFAENYRGAQLISIIERINSYSKYDIQRIGLSATIGNPKDILKWMTGSSSRKGSVIKQADSPKKTKILIRYIDEFSPDSMKVMLPELKDSKSLFFCNSRSNSEMMAKILKQTGVNAKVHHSSVSKGLREISEDKLKSAGEMCLCCTSTMELGIDVGDLDVIVQLNTPSTVASFRQRMGRTGRRPGAESHYEFCVDNSISLVNAIAIVELARKKWIEPINIGQASYTVLFQQLISMILERYGLDKEYGQRIINHTNSFSDISDESIKKFIDYLIQNEYIEYSNGEYILGKSIENRYGYNILMSFISVFETIPEYSVIYRNKEIGTLQSWFTTIASKDNKHIRFALAGSTWEAQEINEEKHRIFVERSKEGDAPLWLGNGETISYEIAQEMLKVLCGNGDYGYIDSKSRSVLKSVRIQHSALGIKENEILIDVVKNGFDIYTFAGHKVNFTLGLIVKQKYGMDFSIGYDRLKLKKGSIKINEEDILNLLKQYSLNDSEIETAIDEALILDEYRSHSKFYDDLPRFAQIEVLKYELFDIQNTKKLLKNSRVSTFNFYNEL